MTQMMRRQPVECQEAGGGGAVDRGQGAGPEGEELGFYPAAGVCGVEEKGEATAGETSAGPGRRRALSESLLAWLGTEGPF